MGYMTTANRWADTLDVAIESASAKTITGVSAGVEIADRGVARLLLNVTAASGTTPTLNVTMQTSSDNATWRSLGTFAQKTAAGSERLSFNGLDKFVRASWVIAGTTPSFTFSISGDAV